MEQVRADRGAQARQAGARDQAEEHHHRHPFPCRDPAGRRLRQAAPRMPSASRCAISPIAETRALKPKQEEDIRARITAYDERLADLDAMGIDMQLVMPPPQPVLLHRAARDRGEGRAAWSTTASPNIVAQASPTASSALGTVPLQDGNEAAKELERCMNTLGMKGVRDPHQCRRQGAVGSGLRAVLEEGRGARRARRDPSERLHRGRAASRASISTTSSAIRSRPRSRCIT